MPQLPLYMDWVPVLAGAYLLARSCRALLDRSNWYWPPESRDGATYAAFIWPFRVLVGGLISVSLLAIPEVAPGIASSRFWVGGILLILGFGFALLATLQLGWSVAFGEDGPLKERGWFRFSRNPIYLSTWAGLAGWAILTPKPEILTALALWAALYLCAIFLEERALARSFGAKFAAYKVRTARFLGWARAVETQGS